MTEEQCQEAYSTLTNILTQNNLDWVIGEVDNEIRLGKIVDRLVKERSRQQSGSDLSFEIVDTRNQRLSSRPIYVQQRVEYTGQERIHILIRAIEHAVINVGDIEENTANSLARHGGFVRLVFEPDGTNEQSFVIEQSQVTIRSKSREQLRQLLEQIKDQVDAA